MIEAPSGFDWLNFLFSKGLYAKARAGALKDLTGIDSPYERPEAPEVHLDVDRLSPETCVETLIKALG